MNQSQENYQQTAYKQPNTNYENDYSDQQQYTNQKYTNQQTQGLTANNSYYQNNSEFYQEKSGCSVNNAQTAQYEQGQSFNENPVHYSRQNSSSQSSAVNAYGYSNRNSIDSNTLNGQTYAVGDNGVHTGGYSSEQGYQQAYSGNQPLYNENMQEYSTETQHGHDSYNAQGYNADGSYDAEAFNQGDQHDNEAFTGEAFEGGQTFFQQQNTVVQPEYASYQRPNSPMKSVLTYESHSRRHSHSSMHSDTPAQSHVLYNDSTNGQLHLASINEAQEALHESMQEYSREFTQEFSAHSTYNYNAVAGQGHQGFTEQGEFEQETEAQLLDGQMLVGQSNEQLEEHATQDQTQENQNEFSNSDILLSRTHSSELLSNLINEDSHYFYQVLSVKTRVNTTLNWKVKDWDAYTFDDKLVSPMFGPENWRWQAVLYPRGVGDGLNEFISVFLRPLLSLKESSQSDAWDRPIDNFTFKVRTNQMTMYHSETSLPTFTGFTSSVTGWGFQKFVSLDEIQELLDDQGSLHVDCDVSGAVAVDVAHCAYAIKLPAMCPDSLAFSFGPEECPWTINCSREEEALAVYLVADFTELEIGLGDSFSRNISSFNLKIYKTADKTLSLVKTLTGGHSFTFLNSKCGWNSLVKCSELDEIVYIIAEITWEINPTLAKLSFAFTSKLFKNAIEPFNGPNDYSYDQSHQHSYDQTMMLQDQSVADQKATAKQVEQVNRLLESAETDMNQLRQEITRLKQSCEQSNSQRDSLKERVTQLLKETTVKRAVAKKCSEEAKILKKAYDKAQVQLEEETRFASSLLDRINHVKSQLKKIVGPESVQNATAEPRPVQSTEQTQNLQRLKIDQLTQTVKLLETERDQLSFLLRQQAAINWDDVDSMLAVTVDATADDFKLAQPDEPEQIADIELTLYTIQQEVNNANDSLNQVKLKLDLVFGMDQGSVTPTTESEKATLIAELSMILAELQVVHAAVIDLEASFHAEDSTSLLQKIHRDSLDSIKQQAKTLKSEIDQYLFSLDVERYQELYTHLSYYQQYPGYQDGYQEEYQGDTQGYQGDYTKNQEENQSNNEYPNQSYPNTAFAENIPEYNSVGNENEQLELLQTIQELELANDRIRNLEQEIQRVSQEQLQSNRPSSTSAQSLSVNADPLNQPSHQSSFVKTNAAPAPYSQSQSQSQSQSLPPQTSSLYNPPTHPTSYINHNTPQSLYSVNSAAHNLSDNTLAAPMAEPWSPTMYKRKLRRSTNNFASFYCMNHSNHQGFTGILFNSLIVLVASMITVSVTHSVCQMPFDTLEYYISHCGLSNTGLSHTVEQVCSDYQVSENLNPIKSIVDQVTTQTIKYSTNGLQFLAEKSPEMRRGLDKLQKYTKKYGIYDFSSGSVSSVTDSSTNINHDSKTVGQSTPVESMNDEPDNDEDLLSNDDVASTLKNETRVHAVPVESETHESSESVEKEAFDVLQENPVNVSPEMLKANPSDKLLDNENVSRASSEEDYKFLDDDTGEADDSDSQQERVVATEPVRETGVTLGKLESEERELVNDSVQVEAVPTGGHSEHLDHRSEDVLVEHKIEDAAVNEDAKAQDALSGELPAQSHETARDSIETLSKDKAEDPQPASHESQGELLDDSIVNSNEKEAQKLAVNNEFHASKRETVGIEGEITPTNQHVFDRDSNVIDADSHVIHSTKEPLEDHIIDIDSLKNTKETTVTAREPSLTVESVGKVPKLPSEQQTEENPQIVIQSNKETIDTVDASNDLPQKRDNTATDLKSDTQTGAENQLQELLMSHADGQSVEGKATLPNDIAEFPFEEGAAGQQEPLIVEQFGNLSSSTPPESSERVSINSSLEHSQEQDHSLTHSSNQDTLTNTLQTGVALDQSDDESSKLKDSKLINDLKVGETQGETFGETRVKSAGEADTETQAETQRHSEMEKEKGKKEKKKQILVKSEKNDKNAKGSGTRVVQSTTKRVQTRASSVIEGEYEIPSDVTSELGNLQLTFEDGL